MTRNGKIARIPRCIRADLNQRLADGEPGKSLVVWLKGQAERILKDVAPEARRRGGAPNSAFSRRHNLPANQSKPIQPNPTGSNHFAGGMEGEGI